MTSTQTTLDVLGTRYQIFALPKLGRDLSRLPFSLRVLLENLLRYEDGRVVDRRQIDAILDWNPKAAPDQEIAFHPARVLLQDFTGVPAVADLAAMRDAMAEMGGNPDRINPLQPADLVIDHSVSVDRFGSAAAEGANADLEFERNRERYEFLRWGSGAFRGFRVVPPDTGICHQVNLEYLAQVVFAAGGQAYFDTLVGTDSHTTMINGVGVVGWGVGGIEAEAAMLGQPISMLVPEVVGVRISGQLAPGSTATDVVLAVTEMLRKKKVVGKFVEYFGPGLSQLALPDRATIANMAPEYGATIGYFPIDAETVAFLRLTGRPAPTVALVEAYAKAQDMFRTDSTPDPVYSDVVELDLAKIVPAMAGPRRPQDRVALSEAKLGYRRALLEMLEQQGEALDQPAAAAFAEGAAPAPGAAARSVHIEQGRLGFDVGHGAVVLAAITSCTNTSNPAVMLGAGLLAKKAVERGLQTMPWVKTSLAPGSKVVTEYLRRAGLLPYLEALGFHVVGYGCTTCIGNSGPLIDAVSEAVKSGKLTVASVLSGNRNFEGRVNPQARMNYLASPPLVVAYALAGTLDVDLTREPLGRDREGRAVSLSDVWPTAQEIADATAMAISAEQYASAYAKVLDGDHRWQKIATRAATRFGWQGDSTYVKRPPFFDAVPKTPTPPSDIRSARILAVLGDSVTTDHISPAGSIPKDSPAGKWLIAHGVEPKDFNSYGARRGNHEVMVRGTLANIRLRNQMVPGIEGGVTLHVPSGDPMSIYDASMRYQKDGTPLVLIAGAEYGTGSSRDWAAKGTKLLGVRAVLAKSFERIHRSNLIGMGILPLQFPDGQDASTLGLTGKEEISIVGVASELRPGKRMTVEVRAADGSTRAFEALCRIDTPNEVDYFVHGGILLYVLRQLLAA